MSAEKKEKTEGRWLTIREYCEKYNLRPCGFNTEVFCSFCEEKNDRKTNYCPNCGKKIRRDK